MKGINYEEESDQIDFNNYKGCFYNKGTEEKYLDKTTGAHFNYIDMCLRLNQLKKKIQLKESLKKPRASVDLTLKSSLKEKIDKKAKPTTKVNYNTTQKTKSNTQYKNLPKQKPEAPKVRQLSAYFNLADKLQVKTTLYANRNKSATKLYMSKATNEKEGEQTQRSLKHEVLFGMQKSIAKLLEEKIKGSMILLNQHSMKVNIPQKKSIAKPFREALKNKPTRTRNMPINETKANNSDRTNLSFIYKTCNGSVGRKNLLKQANTNGLKAKTRKMLTNPKSSNKLCIVEQGSFHTKNSYSRKCNPK